MATTVRERIDVVAEPREAYPVRATFGTHSLALAQIRKLHPYFFHYISSIDRL
jgi:hypothetical protein